MGHDHETLHRGILQQAQHHARIGDPAPPGGDPPGPRLLHQRDLGELAAFQPPGGGGERVDPEIGLAALGDEADPARQVERRGLVGHQRAARDPPELERGLVDGEDAEIDEPRRDQPPARVDHLVAVLV